MIQKADTTYSDTSKEAARKHIEILRQMGMAGRAELTLRLCDELRNTTEPASATATPIIRNSRLPRLICD